MTSSTPPGQPKPFNGTRVLELAGMVAAPFCGKLLAALGADVLKIEPPKTAGVVPFPVIRPTSNAAVRSST